LHLVESLSAVEGIFGEYLDAVRRGDVRVDADADTAVDATADADAEATAGAAGA
jgi:predicted nucleotidyltransferase